MWIGFLKFSPTYEALFCLLHCFFTQIALILWTNSTFSFDEHSLNSLLYSVHCLHTSSFQQNVCALNNVSKMLVELISDEDMDKFSFVELLLKILCPSCEWVFFLLGQSHQQEGRRTTGALPTFLGASGDHTQ